MLPLEIKEFNLKRVGIRAVLGDLETELMEVIWAHKKELTNRELLEILNRKRMKPLEVSTVNITMARLFKKGLVNRRLEAIRGGHHYLYRATMTKKAFVRRISIQILSHLQKCFGDKPFKAIVPSISVLTLDSGSETSDGSE
ncbi:MAG: BlaI/MecI/CopY family transcriptional regulator [Candidatus Hodarchaeota archaeon]